MNMTRYKGSLRSRTHGCKGNTFLEDGAFIAVMVCAMIITFSRGNKRLPMLNTFGVVNPKTYFSHDFNL